MKLAFMTVIVVPGTLYFCFKDWFVFFYYYLNFRTIDLNQWEQEEEENMKNLKTQLSKYLKNQHQTLTF